MRQRLLRLALRRGLLSAHDAHVLAAWEHGGSFPVDAKVHIEAHERDGLERLLRYRARPAFALEWLCVIDPYAQVATMRRWSDASRTGPSGGELSGPAKSAHSYSVCRNRMSESGARYRRILISGASSRARARSFIARSASI